MKKILLVTLMFSSSAFACWKLEGEIKFRSEVIKLDHKVEHGKTYSFKGSRYLYNIRIPAASTTPTVFFEVLKTGNLKLTKVGEAQVIVKENEKASFTIFEKKTQDFTSFEVLLKSI
ncbi:MAG TPA: hypothetical protein VNJ01_06980 [Bacteriovoracaceae bacterium]|nr:hypothetical protein [Bacteriovoracaceae bacterium]